MGDSFQTQCKDFVKNGKTLRVGCKLMITMTKDAEGKWHPFNADGSPHKHAETPAKAKEIVQTPLTDRATFIREQVDLRLKELGLYPK